MKLTQKNLSKLPSLLAGRAETIVFDNDLPGFGVRIRAGGSQTWVYQYKLGDKHRRISIGSLSAIRPEQARRQASEYHAQVRLGHDPAGAKSEARSRAAETFGAVVRSYLPLKRDTCKPGSRSYNEIERHLLIHAKPLHGLQLAKIERRSLATLLSEIATVSGDVTANKVRSTLSTFFLWCIQQGLADVNPVEGTKRRAEQSRDRVLSDAELKVIWGALEDNHYGAVIKLLMLTGQRAAEIAGLRWSEVFDDRIVLPSERTKNGRMHVLPLSGAARAILEAQPKRDDRELIFGVGEGPFSGWSKSKQRLDGRILAATGKTLPPWVPHDLRRTCATRMGELGITPHVIEAVLNHVSGTKSGVAGIYNRSTYEREKVAALSLWADHVLAVVEGHETPVVSLRA
jgi:integrase